MKSPSPSPITEDQLRFLRNLIDAVPLAIFCKDYGQGNGHFVLWNRQATELWGLKEEDVLGKTDYDLFPKGQADFFREKDSETLAKGVTVFIKEEETTSFTGLKISVRTWKITLREEGLPRYLIGISQNIMDFKKLEDEIFKQGQMIAQVDHMAQRTEIARQVAHDVNNPLAIVLGRANQIKRILQRPYTTEEVLQLVEASISIIKESGSRVQYLTRLLEDSEIVETPSSPPEPSAEFSVFYHDLMNLIAIAQGKSRQALRLLSSEGEEQKKHMEEKISSALEALKRLQDLVEDKRGQSDEAS